MENVLAYFLTWTTYGTWLQGDEHGWVKDGAVLAPNAKLKKYNQALMKNEEFRLTSQVKQVVKNAIIEEARFRNHHIHALAVCSNHVHLVLARTTEPIGSLVRNYKWATWSAIRKTGITGKVWTKGYDKRFCFDERSLKARIAYVLNHLNE